MKVLVVGGGGREHALCWKIRQSPLVRDLYCAPGNAGIAAVATCLPARAEDAGALADLVEEKGIDLTVVGPEAALERGLADRLRARGRLVVGPTAAAAEVETSKSFAKGLMRDAGIPTAEFGVFDDEAAALAWLEARGAPIVVKADGLAAGKGVSVCATLDEARAAVRAALVERRFGAAGARVVVEERLCGVEASFIALTDGERFVSFVTAKDHKAAWDGDRGPNTGGMGVVSPAPAMGQGEVTFAEDRVIAPALRALAEGHRRFVGFLYAGLMLGEGGPKVLEFNARFGDPEAEAILVRLAGDLVPALLAAAEGDLSGHRLAFDARPSISVILASGGYPGDYRTGLPIEGLAAAAALPEVEVFHCGTRRDGDRVVTAGGRVLAVTARGATRAEAAARAYEAAGHIRFEGMHFRRDIGLSG
jgi:phosphoribosylamine--glycine ligase